MSDDQQLEVWATVADEAPAEVVDEVPAIADETTRADADERNKALLALSRVAAEYPEAVADVRPALVERLSDDHEVVRYNAVLTLKRVGSEHPDRLLGALRPIAGRLGDPNKEVRGKAGEVLEAVTEEHPEEVLDAVEPVLADLATHLDGDPENRNNATAGFVVAAKVVPGAVAAHGDSLAGRFHDDHAAPRYHATMALKRVATRDPTAVSDYAGAFAGQLDDETEEVRKLAAHALSAIADADPDAVAPATDDIGRAVTDDHDETRYYAVEALCALVADHPGPVASHADDLVEALATGPSYVTESAAETLTDLTTAARDAVTSALTDAGVAVEGDPRTELAAIRRGEVTIPAYDGDRDDADDDGVLSDFRDGDELSIDSIFGAIDDPSVGDVTATADYTADEAVAIDDGRDDCAYTRKVDNEVWECPHDRTDGGTFCVFHAPIAEKDDEAVAEALLEAVTSEGRRDKEFVGARFGDVDLSFAILAADDNFPIDLRHAHVDGDLSCRRLTVRQPLKAGGLTVAGRADFDMATFEMVADFEDATFGAASFNRGAFESRTSFGDARFAGETEFSGARFTETAGFTGTTVEGDASFEKLTVGDTLDVTDATFETDVTLAESSARKIRLQDATFSGDCDFWSLTTEDSVRINGLEVDGDFLLREATIDSSLVGEDVHVGGDFVLTSARITGNLFVDGMRVAGDFKAVGTQAEGVKFDDWSVAGDFDLGTIRARGLCSIENLAVGGDCVLHNGSFENDFQAAKVNVEGDLTAFRLSTTGNFRFARGSVEGETDFKEAVFRRGGSFSEMEFRGPASFTNATFARDASFANATFRAPATFMAVEFEESADFTDATFTGGANFRWATIASGEFTRTTTDTGVIDLSGATLANGGVMLPGGEGVVYDCSDATVGDVDLSVFNDAEDATLFDHFRFLNTTFDGFDFGPYKDELSAAGWQIHTVVDGADFEDDESVAETLVEFDPAEFDDDGRTRTLLENKFGGQEFGEEAIALLEDATTYDDPEKLRAEYGDLLDLGDDGTATEPDPGELENTYLRAKNGADQVGDRKAAAEFFTQEMHYRRRRNARLARTGNGLRERATAAGKWFGNRLLHWSCGYGERLWRVVYVSVVTIVLWGLFYAFLSRGAADKTAGITTTGLDGPGQLLTQEGIVILGKNLYFSVVTFTTLGYGDIQPVGSAARALASIESFFGALLVALVVFVIGRRVAW